MESFGFIGNRKTIDHIALKDAKDILTRGLKHFLGDNCEWLPEYDEVADWLTDNKCRGLLVFGSNGRGKTVICTKVLPLIFKHYLKKEIYMVDATDLNAYYRNQSDNFYITTADVPIIIDDIGVESIVSEYGDKKDLVSEIIDRSEKRNRLLIMTTNLTPTEIEERYGLRTLDRLKSIVRAIKCHGDSMRKW